jgi:hypothetical protein
VKLADWLDEYRRIGIDDLERPVATPVDDWDEPEIMAPADRVRDTTPRWRERAVRVGYARATQV